MKVQFSKIKIGEDFSRGGNRYKKRSTKTAEIVEPAAYRGRKFYFGNTEIVTSLKKR